MKYPNFFETIKEARMRLEQTVITHNGFPYYCLTVGDDTEDGIFDVYLDPLRDDQMEMAIHQYGDIPFHWIDEEDGETKSDRMRKWLQIRPDSGVITKKANDPGFNNFRPFPLGMVNIAGQVTYTERSPTRNMQQGLTGPMLKQWHFGADRRASISITSPYVKDTILGDYPDAKACLDAVSDPRCANKDAAFHRYFAISESVSGFLFLAYKSDLVGLLPNGDFSRLVLGTEYTYTKEVIEELELFEKIDYK